MLKNTDGKKDAVLTMSVITLAVILIRVLFAGVKLTISGVVLDMGAIDSGLVAALLTPTLGAYVARRYTERKFAIDLNNNGIIDEDEKVPNAD